MQPIRSRYAGTCARTGQRYAVGDLVVKLANGKWALAQDKAGKIKIAPDWRLIRLPDGAERQANVAAPLACGACVRADGHDPAHPPESFDVTLYHMTREGDAFRCPHCDRRIEIVSQAEIDAREAEAERQRQEAYEADLQANLHLEPAGYGWFTLSHRLGPARWSLVAEHFRYWSHDDLDDMDYFDMPGGWYLLGDPAPEGVLLNGAPTSSPGRAERVEEILGIRPENRLAVLIPKWEAQERAAKKRAEAARIFDSLYYRLFCHSEDGDYLDGNGNPFEHGASYVVLPEGEMLNWKKGYTIYGGGSILLVEPDGAYVWHLSSNGGDGDDWSRNNSRMGIAIRYPLTEERRAFLETLRSQQKSEDASHG